MGSYYSTEKKESFFANHVKLITFLCVIGVFLLIFGPIFVMNAVQWFSGDARPQMTEFQMDSLDCMSLESGIDYETVTQYSCVESNSQSAMQATLSIKSTIAGYPDYTVIVVADKNTKKIISGKFIDNRRNVEMDLFKGELSAYLDYIKTLEKGG